MTAVAAVAAVAISAADVMQPAMARIEASVGRYSANIGNGEVNVTVKMPVGDFCPHHVVVAIFTNFMMELVKASRSENIAMA
jgi:hypothetical protein